MTLALWSLLGFTVWTVLLVGAGVALPRAVLVLQRRKRANAFEPSDVTQAGGLVQRIGRAHANCVENLGVFASLVLVGHAAGVQVPAYGILAVVVLGARITQSSVHLVSVSELAVMVRFTFYVIQVLCYLALAAVIASAA